MFLFLIGVFGFNAVSGHVLGLRDGDGCVALGGGQGTCKLLSKCDTVGDFRVNKPPICGFNGLTDLEPIICCPNPKVVVGRKIKKVCDELKSICKYPYRSFILKAFITTTTTTTTSTPKYNKCSDLESIGEPDCPNNEPPWLTLGLRVKDVRTHRYMALIGYSPKDMVCGGSLITPRYILSAAHCTKRDNIPIIWARLGEFDYSLSEDDARPEDRNIVEIIVHPKYSRNVAYHDIALLKLDRDVEFNWYILPICLQTERHITDKIANMKGWGRTGTAEGLSNQLLEIDIEIYNDTECQRRMFRGINNKSPDGYKPDFMFCAGDPGGRGDSDVVKDMCSGDSGSPLVINKDSCNVTQVGIASFNGQMCGDRNASGVYTRVSNYISWIEEIAFADVHV